jgi:hypothetical protein
MHPPAAGPPSGRAGAIRGYTAVITEGVAEEGVAAIIRITLDKQTEEYLNRFEAAVRMHPEIIECYLMTGDADYCSARWPEPQRTTSGSTKKSCQGCRGFPGSTQASQSAGSCNKKRAAQWPAASVARRALRQALRRSCGRAPVVGARSGDCLRHAHNSKP